MISPKAVIQGGILRFPAVEPADESQYLCRVRNSAGQHMARAFLQVQSTSGRGSARVSLATRAQHTTGWVSESPRPRERQRPAPVPSPLPRPSASDQEGRALAEGLPRPQSPEPIFPGGTKESLFSFREGEETVS